MSTNLRISLTVLSIGFAVEGAEELYTLATPGASHPGASLWFLVPAILTLIGIVFVWIGRHEFNEVHMRRARRASLIFALSLVGGVIAALVVGFLVAYPALGTPLWAEVLFGAALASLLFGTFVTYAYLVFHLVAAPSKVALGAAVVWAFAISTLITISLAGDLPTVIGLIQTRSLDVPSFLSPVDTLVSYLFLSYFLLLAAYVEAHLALVRGTATSAGRRPPTVPEAPP